MKVVSFIYVVMIVTAWIMTTWKIPMSKHVKFIRNGSEKWIGIKFPRRKGAVWVNQSDFDDLVVDTK